MAILSCTVTVNSKGEEIEQHGTTQFPISYYEENLLEASIPWHWHEDLEIIWVTSGSIKVFVNTTEYIVNQNQGIFINAGLLHTIQSHSNDVCVSRSIVFHPRLIGSLDSIYWQNYVEPIIQNKSLPFIFLESSDTWKDEIIALSNSVWTKLYKNDDWFEMYVRNELSEIILIILKNYSMCETKTNIQKIRNAKRIKSMLQYIHKHFSEEITIADLANESLVSASEVLRCFHNTVHTTPNQYLKQYRIQRASKMLTDTDMTSLEIALECGFQSSSYFTKSFKEKMGCTPLSYRKKHNSIKSNFP